MALSIINKCTSVVVNTSFFFTNNMNQNDPIETERLPESVATDSEQIAKLNERVVTLSKLAVSAEGQLAILANNSSEYKSLNTKVKGWQEDIDRIQKTLELMNYINPRPLKQERDSLLRAVKDVAKTAKKFGDNSNGQKYWLYFQDLCGNNALNDDEAVVLLSLLVCDHQMGSTWFASTVRPLKE
jgi:hypothetical protein